MSSVKFYLLPENERHTNQNYEIFSSVKAGESRFVVPPKLKKFLQKSAYKQVEQFVINNLALTMGSSDNITFSGVYEDQVYAPVLEKAKKVMESNKHLLEITALLNIGFADISSIEEMDIDAVFEKRDQYINAFIKANIPVLMEDYLFIKGKKTVNNIDVIVKKGEYQLKIADFF